LGSQKEAQADININSLVRSESPRQLDPLNLNSLSFVFSLVLFSLISCHLLPIHAPYIYLFHRSFSKKSKEGKEKARCRAMCKEYVGQPVTKDFPPHGIFNGVVKNYDSDGSCWMLVYEDGDREEVNWDDLEKLLADGANGHGLPRRVS